MNIHLISLSLLYTFYLALLSYIKTLSLNSPFPLLLACNPIMYQKQEGSRSTSFYLTATALGGCKDYSIGKSHPGKRRSVTQAQWSDIHLQASLYTQAPPFLCTTRQVGWIFLLNTGSACQSLRSASSLLPNSWQGLSNLFVSWTAP